MNRFNLHSKLLGALMLWFGFSLASMSALADPQDHKSITVSCDVSKSVCQASGTDSLGDPITNWTSWFTPENNKNLKKKNTKTAPPTNAKSPSPFIDTIPCNESPPGGTLYTWHVSALSSKLEQVDPSATVTVYCYP